ncbi:uncharacterized protein SPPG_08572 [Spizellomyces punctatus DAOM BR117]|uniref:SMP-30/Gluconolactonase/LRE-like region domain-containing protein n=1 Tax=Spizellomyces punctatus (strain DAOM BR117) TaxID=645134 RepID=A0A0L0H437_SPIPD|nr:uncharacterized protein SPPG_08572 [Spizellomyces punctatus DAOM BR117]KNC95967.1 hypothetical protein SPPG_08572 [Spizellomyces punctatus DAOM BR117]|eukprot:XP_016604007.1 hypothetical protein SPPG_08572 [Spizellomyces punctatus DAOM BR117]
MAEIRKRNKGIEAEGSAAKEQESPVERPPAPRPERRQREPVPQRLDGIVLDPYVFFAVKVLAVAVVGLLLWVIFYGNQGLGGKPFPEPATVGSPLLDSSALEVVADLPSPPGSVAVAHDGRIFFSFHPQHGHDTKLAYWDPANKTYTPFPTIRNQLGFNAITAVVIHNRTLFVLDHGLYGAVAPMLVWWDLTTNKEKMRYMLADLAGYGSTLSSLSVHPDGRRVFITDSSMLRGFPSIIEVDTFQLTAAIVLSSKKLRAEPYLFTTDVDTKGPRPLKWSYFNLLPWRPAVSSIIVDRSGEWVYFAATASNVLYRVPTAALQKAFDAKDPTLANKLVEISSTHKPASTGMLTGKNGDILLSDFQTSSIRAFDPTAPASHMKQIVRDPTLLRWPEQMSIGPDGYLYIANSALHLPLTGRKASSGQILKIKI